MKPLLASLLLTVSPLLAAVVPAPAPTEVKEVAPGPWGCVRYVPLQISPPSALVESFVDEPQEIRWFVMVHTRSELVAWLTDKGLSADQVGALVADASQVMDGRGWLLLPPPELVLGLPSDTRMRLYGGLAKWAENPRHRSPFRLVDHATATWREMSGLKDAALSRFDRLVYSRGTMQVFTDLPLMLIALKGDKAAQIRFLRSVCSESTYLASLRVLPGDNIDALAAYWGKGGREEDVRSLIEAAARAGGEIGVPLPLLLPSFPRRVLYTYVPIDEQRFLDCHYTSINFFSREPDTRMLEGTYRDVYFNAFYDEVPEMGELGDILLLQSPSGEVVHSCVYLCADLIFSKNGGQRTLPWTIMTLPDIKEYFSTEGELKVRVFRRKSNTQ